MKRNSIIYVASLIALLVGTIIYAQVTNTKQVSLDNSRDKDEEHLLESLHNIYRDISEQDPAKTCSLNYSVITSVREQNDSLVQSAVDVACTGREGWLSVITSDLKLYQDKEAGVSVIPSEREIQIFPSTSSDLEAARRQSVQTFRDDFFRQCQILKKTYNNKSNEYTLILQPDKALAQKFPVESVEVVFSPTEERISSVQLKFRNDFMYESMKVIYRSIECSEQSDESAQNRLSALEVVYNQNGKLKAEYSGYEVIDHRVLSGAE
ncbi:MAG: hypothetical protein AB7H80_07140 [Candidatus Kapaibacterium sp.]